MAFGYQEGEFTVEKTFDLQVNDMAQRMEIRSEVIAPFWEQDWASLPPERRPSESELFSKRYISLEGRDDQGKLVMDVLLLYMGNAALALEADWQRLTTEPHVQIDDLHGWFEQVIGHDTGYGRNGGIAMY